MYIYSVNANVPRATTDKCQSCDAMLCVTGKIKERMESKA